MGHVTQKSDPHQEIPLLTDNTETGICLIGAPARDLFL